MKIRYELWDTAWDRFATHIRDLAARQDVRRVCEIGAGANPCLPPEFVREHHLDYVLLDASHEELAKAPGDYVKVCGDIMSPRPGVEGPFDLVLSRFVAEHIPDPRGFHANIGRLLREGGLAVHFFPTLYALPFLVNRALPERLTSALLLRIQPRRVNHGRHGKFPAYYRWCRGPTKRQMRRLEDVGFETREYVGYFGHGYYEGAPFVDSVAKRSAQATVRYPVAALTSYAMVTLRAGRRATANPFSPVTGEETEPSRPARVAFISSHAQLGGSERYLELLLDHIGADWVHRVIALTDGPFVARLRSAGRTVDVFETPARLGMVPAAWRLRRAVLTDPPDVVHANGIKAALLAGHALVGTGIPVVWVKHDLYWDGRLAKVVAARSRRVISVSSAAGLTFGGRLGDRLAVVPNALPPVAVDPAAGRALVLELAGTSDVEVVVLAGRLHRAKGQHEAVELAGELRSKRPQLRWLLVGDEDRYTPSYAAELRARVVELELQDTVRFTGYRGDLLEILSGCDAAIVPSGPDERDMGREGFGLVALEAMAVGTPVIGYADGGVPEVLGACGMLVPAGDRAGLGRALIRVLEDSNLGDRLAACGRARVSERFAIATLVDTMRGHYTDLAAAPGS